MGMSGDCRFTKPMQLRENMCIKGFDSGVAIVDDWLAKRAMSAKPRGSAVVYMSYEQGASIEQHSPAGFYTLSSTSVARDTVRGGWLRRNAPEQIPVILLGMLGVDRRFQGNGLGKMLLHDAAIRAMAVSDSIGAKALVVDPVSDEAGGFYARYGFKVIPGTSRMFVPLTR